LPLPSAVTHFEGPEKKLEIILFSSRRAIRANTDGRWDRVVRASGAEVISCISTDAMDAYLLSESSLFVWGDRVLMITCGQTQLVQAVPEIMEIVGRDQVAMVFYERKNLMFPSRQPADFEADVVKLEAHFPGKSYRLGPANHDHVHVFFSSHAKIDAEHDATFQLLMSDLDPSATEIFTDRKAGTAVQAARLSRLTGIYDGMEVDGHFFTPYGYSLNGVNGQDYYTLHVTPQHDGSYASFETSVIEKDYARVISEVLSLFRPGRFSVLLTTSMDDGCLPLHETAAVTLPGYGVTEKSLYEFDCGYAITYLNHVSTV
jgi:S-adenosylmethionine decarboxylase